MSILQMWVIFSLHWCWGRWRYALYNLPDIHSCLPFYNMLYMFYKLVPWFLVWACWTFWVFFSWFLFIVWQDASICVFVWIGNQALGIHVVKRWYWLGKSHGIELVWAFLRVKQLWQQCLVMLELQSLACGNLRFCIPNIVIGKHVMWVRLLVQNTSFMSWSAAGQSSGRQT